MRVALVSIDGYVYPKTCPCCSATASSLETIAGSASDGQIKTKLAVKMPSCADCLDHRRVGMNEAVFCLIVAAVALIVAGVARFVMEAELLFQLATGVFVLALIAAPIVHRLVRNKWPENHPGHASIGPAVRVKPYFGEVIFDFENEDFGTAFKDMNKPRLAKTQ